MTPSDTGEKHLSSFYWESPYPSSPPHSLLLLPLLLRLFPDSPTFLKYPLFFLLSFLRSFSILDLDLYVSFGPLYSGMYNPVLKVGASVLILSLSLLLPLFTLSMFTSYISYVWWMKISWLVVFFSCTFNFTDIITLPLMKRVLIMPNVCQYANWFWAWLSFHMFVMIFSHCYHL